ncbi:uncharacterized protein LOC141680086 [Apium graveolens]|uniref:uncharacterized protein LOC141680086 n=1 Tax=Apium graveolens TaxID=4045 RepID=UPI003D799B59
MRNPSYPGLYCTCTVISTTSKMAHGQFVDVVSVENYKVCIQSPRPQDLVIYYGGHFMTCLKYQYAGPKLKCFKGIEVKELSVKKIREIVNDVVKDDDKLYYAKNGVTPDLGFKMLLPFNPSTTGKDIKWRPGLIFGSKKQFKNAVREYYIATGRPLKYRVDDLHRMHIVCTEGCPFRLWLSYMVEYKGWVRKRALSGIAEEMVKYYVGLRRFGGEILRSNKENTVKISTTRMNEQDSPCFQRFYVYYAELRKGWKEGCRPIIGLDGSFLKTVCGGQLLSAVGRDGNNSIFPVAMVVVETESYDRWTGYGYTFTSDQQKGIIKAVKELLPYIEHRNCTRHIYSNLGKKHGSEAVRNAFYDASDATHPEAFKAAMRDLEKASKRDWVIINRFMPLIDMLTDIHDKIMERLHQKRDAMQNVDCIILPRTHKILNDAVVASSECSVLWDGRHNFQVEWRGIGFCVNLTGQTCSCRVWELTGVPCCHAVAAIQKSRLNPTDFVSHYFKKETYMKAYSHFLEVIRGEPFWEEVDGDNIMPPPRMKTLRGRPKRQRRREGWEGSVNRGGNSKLSKLNRQGRVMHYSNCKKPGHNITKCPEETQRTPSTKKIEREKEEENSRRRRNCK